LFICLILAAFSWYGERRTPGRQGQAVNYRRRFPVGDVLLRHRFFTEIHRVKTKNKREAFCWQRANFSMGILASLSGRNDKQAERNLVLMAIG